jgi:hypothetical protein
MRNVMQSVLLAVLLYAGTQALTACATPQPQPAAEHIDESSARELVVKRYQELFRKSYFREDPSGRYVQYPALEATDLKYAEFRGDAWLVQADPPGGLLVRARVGPQGEWVEFTTVVFNTW